MSYIELDQVTKSIHGRRVLDGITLSIPKGTIAGFTGINGSGKSMLLRSVAGLASITSGTIEIDGKRLDRKKPYPVRLGLMMDAAGFWEHLSGRENLEALAGIRKVASAEDIAGTLALVGLEPSDRRPVHAYSLGMKQCLNLAQAVLEKPELLIMDEPTNALDEEGIQLVADVLGAERARGATILVSCHCQPKIEALFDLHYPLHEGAIREIDQT